MITDNENNNDTQPFQQHSPPFFFLYGQIDDQFCPPTLGFLYFSRMLHRHLRELGYQRIVFYNSGEQKIDTYDTQSSALVRPNAEPQPQTPRRTTKICVGHLGQRRQFKARPKTQTTPQLTAVNNLEAVVSFNRWMNEVQPKTAIIFTNWIDFITHFDQAAQRQMSVALENWGRLFEDNQNICIFLLSGISVQRLLELQELRRQWFFLFNKMFKTDNTPTHRMIPIGAARLDEVNNLLNELHRWLPFTKAPQILLKRCRRPDDTAHPELQLQLS